MMSIHMLTACNVVFVLSALALTMGLIFTMATISEREPDRHVPFVAGFCIAIALFVPFCFFGGIYMQDCSWVEFVGESGKMEYRFDKETGGAVLQWKEEK